MSATKGTRRAYNELCRDITNGVVWTMKNVKPCGPKDSTPTKLVGGRRVQSLVPQRGRGTGSTSVCTLMSRRRAYTGWEMSAYQTIVVGTDGSDSSLRAVDRAAAIAADNGAKLIVATAHLPVPEEKGRYAIPPGSTHGQDYRVVGDAPFYAILHDARERAHKAGAKNVEEKDIVGPPINALVDLAKEVHADLLVVGNVGLSSVAGRLLGSVPSEVSRRSKTDVLIVHTIG